MNELIIPPKALTDESSREILRVWQASGHQQFSMIPNAWADPAGWGLLFVDIARQIASAYSQGDPVKHTRIIERIKHGFDIEWEKQTDIPEIKPV